MVAERGEEILKEIVNQIRAYDTYGTWEKKSDHDILNHLFLTKPEKQASLSLMGHCEVDPKALLKLHAYFKAIGVLIEKSSGLLTSVVINLDEEGNGIVLIYSGRLILVNKSIRDANKFRFKSLDEMALQAQKFIDKALELLEKYSEVANI